MMMETLSASSAAAARLRGSALTLALVLALSAPGCDDGDQATGDRSGDPQGLGVSSGVPTTGGTSGSTPTPPATDPSPAGAAGAADPTVAGGSGPHAAFQDAIDKQGGQLLETQVVLAPPTGPDPQLRLVVPPYVMDRTPEPDPEPRSNLPTPEDGPLRGSWQYPQRDGRPMTLLEQREVVRDQLAVLREKRRRTYADADKPDDLDAQARLRAFIEAPNTTAQRLSALRGLNLRNNVDNVRFVESLTTHETFKIATEAAILLYRAGHKVEALKPVMVDMARRGGLMSSAFIVEEVRGRPIWDAYAPTFFAEAVRSPDVRVRIDAALHLFELDTPQRAVVAIQRILDGAERYTERLDAVGLLTRVAYREDVQLLLNHALNDAHPKVVARAQAILDAEAGR